LIETGDGAKKEHVGFGAYILYTLNFTTFVSGPIQRYEEFARDQFATEPVPLGPRVIGSQLERIVRGFFKVTVLAMIFNMVRVDALAHLSQPLPLSLKLYAAFQVALIYPLFLYAKFLRVHRHRDCPGAPDARAPAGELRPAVLGDLVHRFLEPLAYNAVYLAQNVCL
jgi:D-alanyl-lipoteichoic acid acyltransferase DltB (MBOAT superfamily)